MDLSHIKLDKFKVFTPQTLFPLEGKEIMELARKGYCYCGNRIKKTRNGDLYCSSKKHKRSLYIKNGSKDM